MHYHLLSASALLVTLQCKFRAQLICSILCSLDHMSSGGHFTDSKPTDSHHACSVRYFVSFDLHAI